MNERPILLHAARGVYSLPLCLGLMLATAGGAVSQRWWDDEPEGLPGVTAR
ncbi:MAG: hypothetical protein OXN85_14905 [Gemmatimonadetes bacterium]|nr:hypothetical protein [Candidatus Palauibacter australiensis]